MNSDNESDRKYMEMAVAEARMSKGEDDRARPKVGAVVVKDGKVLATAHRGETGEGDHAEFGALEKKLAEEDVSGATVFTTLEPCTKRNWPKIPCVERLIERKVKRVVMGMLDPNREILGLGVWRLREANIITELFKSDFMSQLEDLNRDFVRLHRAASKESETKQSPYADDAIYYAVSEVAERLGVDEERVYQWGVTGRLIFSFIRNKPANYEEQRVETDENGQDVKITRRHQSIEFYSGKPTPSSEIFHIKPSDTKDIILNKFDNRKILVSELFSTADLLPGNRRVLLNNPQSVEKADLVITKEALQRFINAGQSATN